MKATIKYCTHKITTDEPMSLNPPPRFCTTVSAAKLNPMNEAWKYLIRKFQNIVFLIFMKNICTLGLFFVITNTIARSNSDIRIPIADSATPSKLLNTSLFVMAVKCRVEAICYLSIDERLITPEIASMTKSTLAGLITLLRLTRRIAICKTNPLRE